MVTRFFSSVRENQELVYVVIVTLFVCFVALRPKSTVMVMAGWSIHLTTLFPGQALPVLGAHTFACN